jgi:hypothetical protein
MGKRSRKAGLEPGKKGVKAGSEPRPQGRQNAFAGAKLEFLDSHKDEFLDSTDRGGFYTSITKTFIQKFGYCPGDDGDEEDEGGGPPDEIDTSLPVEEQEKEAERCEKLYRNLRDISPLL